MRGTYGNFGGSKGKGEIIQLPQKINNLRYLYDHGNTIWKTMAASLDVEDDDVFDDVFPVTSLYQNGSHYKGYFYFF